MLTDQNIGKKMPAAICVIPILSIYVNLKPSDLSNVTRLQCVNSALNHLREIQILGQEEQRDLGW